MNKNQRGDTLVEVLIAITVLGIIVAGCLAVMNRSLVSILNSAERTASRADINSQTDMLNYVYHNDKADWNKILNLAVKKAPTDAVPSDITDACKITEDSKSSATIKAGSFYLDPVYDASNGSISDVNVKEALKKNTHGVNQLQRAKLGQGLWIDAVYYSTVSHPYVDFYIKACWVPFGGNDLSGATNTRSITVVRIYVNNTVSINETSGDKTA